MTPAPALLFGGLIAWSLYRRVRRNIGRQKLHPRRAWTSIIVLSLFSVLVVSTSLHHLNVLLGFGGGLLPGAFLGWLGLRLTRFEPTSEGLFYTPSAHIGVALSILFIGRLAYRLIVLRSFSTTPHQPPAVPHSPLTLLIFGLVAGYYITFYAGVLSRSRDRNPALS